MGRWIDQGGDENYQVPLSFSSNHIRPHYHNSDPYEPFPLKNPCREEPHSRVLCSTICPAASTVCTLESRGLALLLPSRTLIGIPAPWRAHRHADTHKAQTHTHAHKQSIYIQKVRYNCNSNTDDVCITKPNLLYHTHHRGRRSSLTAEVMVSCTVPCREGKRYRSKGGGGKGRERGRKKKKKKKKKGLMICSIPFAIYDGGTNEKAGKVRGGSHTQ